MLPASFQRIKTLANLNNVAVGLAIAACTAAVFSMGNGVYLDVITGLPTLLVGAAWMRLLRWDRNLGRTRVRLGWVLSIPLAALNAGLAGALLLGGEGHNPIQNGALGLFIGVTFGALFWVPALILTLLLFGLPIAWAQRQAKKGLAGEERGERIVGIAGLVFSTIALLLTGTFGMKTTTPEIWGMRPAALGLSVLGILFSAFTTAIAQMRENRRRAFVTAAEKGEMPGYRVDPTPEGKVLVRVAKQQSYRVADIDEDVAVLDDEGGVQALKQAAMPVPSDLGPRLRGPADYRPDWPADGGSD